jgi:hypothetical protein
MNHFADPRAQEAGTKLWNAALPEIRGAMTQGTFDTWLRHAQPLEYVTDPEGSPDGDPLGNGGLLTVGVPNPHAMDWLNNRLSAVVLRALRTVMPRLSGVRFVLQHADPPTLRRMPAREPSSGLLGNEQTELPTRDPAAEMRSGTPQARNRRRASQARSAVSSPTECYVKVKVALRTYVLGELKGAPLSVFFCLALHVDRDGISSPGIGCIMRETRYSRPSVCRALNRLCSPPLRLVEKLPDPDKLRGTDQYRLRGYAWFGTRPAPALFELD